MANVFTSSCNVRPDTIAPVAILIVSASLISTQTRFPPCMESVNGYSDEDEYKSGKSDGVNNSDAPPLSKKMTV